MQTGEIAIKCPTCHKHFTIPEEILDYLQIEDGIKINAGSIISILQSKGLIKRANENAVENAVDNETTLTLPDNEANISMANQFLLQLRHKTRLMVFVVTLGFIFICGATDIGASFLLNAMLNTNSSQLLFIPIFMLTAATGIGLISLITFWFTFVRSPRIIL